MTIFVARPGDRKNRRFTSSNFIKCKAKVKQQQLLANFAPALHSKDCRNELKVPLQLPRGFTVSRWELLSISFLRPKKYQQKERMNSKL